MLEILESVTSLITEVKFKKVIRGGKLLKKIACPPGFKNAGGKCTRMTQMEVRKRKKAAKLMLKTKKKTLKGIKVIMMERRRKKSMILRARKHI